MDCPTLVVNDHTAKYHAARSSPVLSVSTSMTSAFMELGSTQKEPPRNPVAAPMGSM